MVYSYYSDIGKEGFLPVISFVKGKVADISALSATIECGGLGFEVFMPPNALWRLTVGQEVKVHTYLHVKEDLMQLYGFNTPDDLEIFRLLINVSGIGPRGALSILGVMTADELRLAVLSDDDKRIAKAPGIGKKTAQKVIIELKDKLKLSSASEETSVLSGDIGTEEAMDARKDAIAALAALGYSPTDAAKAVNKTDASLTDTEQVLKAALRYLYTRE